MAQTRPTHYVTAAVFEVTFTTLVTAGSPHARLALAHTIALITRGLVTVARVCTSHPPVPLVALTLACLLVTAGAYRPTDVTLARFGTG